MPKTKSLRLLDQKLPGLSHGFRRLAFLIGTLLLTGNFGGNCLIPTFRTDALLSKTSGAGMAIEGPAISIDT